MRRHAVLPAFLIHAALILFPAASVVSAQGTERAWKWTAETVVLQPRVIAAAISPDGTRIVSARTRPRRADEKPGGVYVNLWIVAAAGGDARQLTFADSQDASPAWSPDGRFIAFLSARGDGAKRQVWLLPADGGEPFALTSVKTGVSAFQFSPDGKLLAYTAPDPPTEKEEKDRQAGQDWTVKEQNEKPVRLHVIDVATRASRAVTSAGDLTVYEFAWSPSADALVANAADTPRTDDSYMGKRTMIFPLEGAASKVAEIGGKIAEVAWSPDGRTIAFVAAIDRSDPHAGALFTVPKEGGAPRNLTPDYEGMIQHIRFRPDGRILALAAESTKSVVAVYDPATGAREIMIGKGDVVLTGLDAAADGDAFAAVGSSAAHPNEVFGGRLSARTAARLTRTTPDLETLPRGRQETFAWKARDGLSLEGVLIYPHDFREGTAWPLVACVHGGPEAHEPDNWKTTDYIRIGQAGAERGWFVFYPNYRASTGRGTAFAKLDHGDLGGREFDDVVDGIDALVARGFVDPKRVGAIGGSYGGYFTAWAATKLSDRFAAGVEHFGISNWVSFMGQTDIPVENEIVHMARPFYENMDLYWDRSPIRWIANARTPTLILQGAADDRVPKPQSDELWQALRRKGVPCEYVVYPREPHGYRERAHVIDAFDRAMGWFTRYLGIGGE